MILITGGAGYIGSHCVLDFIKDYDVVIFDNLETGHIETIETLKKISSKVEFFKGDLKNKIDIEILFKKYDIEAIIHFAGLSIVKESVEEPRKYYENNVLGTKNLLDVMVQNNVLNIIFSSTASIFGEPKYLPIDENHPKNPINPYGETKLKIENMLADYDKKYNLKSVCLRYFNVVGADNKARIGEWHINETHLVPNILKSVFEKEKVFKIFGDNYDTKDGTAIRDYIDINDLILAHRLSFEYLKKEQKSDVFNLGTKNGASVKEIFELAKETTKKEIKYEIVQKREGDPAILIADNKKAKEKLGWQNQISIKESIKKAYEWHKKSYNS